MATQATAISTDLDTVRLQIQTWTLLAAQARTSPWPQVVTQAPHICLFLTASMSPGPPPSTVPQMLSFAFLPPPFTYSLTIGHLGVSLFQPDSCLTFLTHSGHLSKDGTSHCRRGPPISIINRENKLWRSFNSATWLLWLECRHALSTFNPKQYR